jgi:multidrug efflux system outer membrane protein
VADFYFTLCAQDADIALLRQTLQIREESLNILRKRMEIGVITELDIAESVVDLENTRGQMQAVLQQRKENEHALAILLGAPPAHFALPEKPLASEPPLIPPGLPSSLLERRPDVVAAQKTLAAANARIGIARAAFFPVLSLTANGGLESATLADLFQWSSRSWAIGPLLTIPIFSGGAATANYKRSQAIYDEAVAEYRQQVLVAFRDVEDSLSRLKSLSDRSASQATAEAAARRAAEIAGKRYDIGASGYLEFITARRNALEAERLGISIRRDRLVNTVRLIRALGGGW